MGAVSTDEERAAISSEFETVEDWLYEEGRNLDAAAYAKRKKELSAMTAPLFLRAHEMEARPKAITQANDAINWTLTILDSWASERPEVTTEERDHVSGLCANLTSWMQAQEEAQAALTAFDAPAYLSTDLAARLEPIERQVRQLTEKPAATLSPPCGRPVATLWPPCRRPVATPWPPCGHPVPTRTLALTLTPILTPAGRHARLRQQPQPQP